MAPTMKPKYISVDRALEIVRDILERWAVKPMSQKLCQKKHSGIVAAAFAIENAAKEGLVHVYGRKVTRHGRKNQPCDYEDDLKEIRQLTWFILEIDSFLEEAFDCRAHVPRYIDLHLDEHEVINLKTPGSRLWRPP